MPLVSLNWAQVLSFKHVFQIISVYPISWFNSGTYSVICLYFFFQHSAMQWLRKACAFQFLEETWFLQAEKSKHKQRALPWPSSAFLWRYLKKALQNESTCHVLAQYGCKLKSKFLTINTVCLCNYKSLVWKGHISAKGMRNFISMGISLEWHTSNFPPKTSISICYGSNFGYK